MSSASGSTDSKSSSARRRDRRKKAAGAGGSTGSNSGAKTATRSAETKQGPTLSSGVNKTEFATFCNELTSDLRNSLSKFAAQHPGVAPADLVECLRSAVAPILDGSINPVSAVSAPVEIDSKKKKPVRVYVDGCFDITHSGHYNAVRQAKALADVLVVGVHSDAEILKHKGPPVMNEEERVATIRACKWVDEIEFDTPYDPTLELLNRLNCDFCVHGDDMPTTSDGRDAYAEVKQAGRLRIIKRTEGVSTTDLVGRMLLMTNSHLVTPPAPGQNSPTTTPAMALSSSLDEADFKLPASAAAGASKTANKPAAPAAPASSAPAPAAATAAAAAAPVLPGANPKVYESAMSNFLPTTWRISQFANHRAPKPTDKIIYIDGAFDLFHIGHIETLEKVKKHGDFLYVGVHDDVTVNKHKGRNYPIMNLHERVLNVLSCKFVDEVVIGAPWIITKDLITTLGISLVLTGSDGGTIGGKIDPKRESPTAATDPYAVPKQLGIFKQVDTTRQLNTDDVIKRIIDNRLKYEKRNEKRVVKEATYMANKTFVAEISN